MVDRYTLMLFEHDAEMDPDSIGEWVKHADYLALQAALREALGNWDVLLTGAAKPLIFEHRKRIAALRAQFLDDK